MEMNFMHKNFGSRVVICCARIFTRTRKRPGGGGGGGGFTVGEGQRAAKVSAETFHHALDTADVIVAAADEFEHALHRILA